MSDDQNTACENKNCCRQYDFLSLFRGFNQALFPLGKWLFLSFLLVIGVGTGFWLLDGITSGFIRARVVVQSAPAPGSAASDLEAFVRGDDWKTYRQQSRSVQIDRLRSLASQTELELKDRPLESTAVHDLIEKEYAQSLSVTRRSLERQYKNRGGQIEENYLAARKEADAADKKRLERENELNRRRLDEAFLSLFESACGLETSPVGIESSLSTLIIAEDSQSDTTDIDGPSIDEQRRQVRRTVLLAQANRISHDLRGQGVAGTFVGFISDRLHQSMLGILRLNPNQIVSPLIEIAQAKYWLLRFHPLIATLMFLILLPFWTLLGGAICRMTALQIARAEPSGPIPALKFCTARWKQFLPAPMVPMIIVCVLGLLIWIGGLLGTIPGIDVLVAIGLILALLVAALASLVWILYAAGGHLIVPSVATEGSNALDAMSRSFAYTVGSPWHLGFYGLISFVYGAICYLFIRLFMWLMLVLIHGFAGLAMNGPQLAYNPLQDKLSGIWPTPTFFDLIPNIPWQALNWHESIVAFFICGWVCILVALISAFAVSYFFTTTTTIYFLLRKHVDKREMDEIYLDESVEEMLQVAEDQCLKDEPPVEDASEPSSEEPSDPVQGDSPETSTASNSDTDDEQKPPSES